MWLRRTSGWMYRCGRRLRTRPGGPPWTGPEPSSAPQALPPGGKGPQIYILHLTFLLFWVFGFIRSQKRPCLTRFYWTWRPQNDVVIFSRTSVPRKKPLGFFLLHLDEEAIVASSVLKTHSSVFRIQKTCRATALVQRPHGRTLPLFCAGLWACPRGSGSDGELHSNASSGPPSSSEGTSATTPPWTWLARSAGPVESGQCGDAGGAGCWRKCGRRRPGWC